MTFRPMLATRETLTQADIPLLRYPMMVSPKLDGIRCLITEDGPVTRTLKLIKNTYVRERLSCLPVGLDGELIVGPMTGPGVFKRTQSGVMSEDGEPDFIFHVFDHFGFPGVFEHRLNEARRLISFTPRAACPVYHLPHEMIWRPDKFQEMEEHYVAQGFEGMMVRDPYGPYKYGRATRKEATLLKFKRFRDAEARVTGVVELMRNANELKEDAFGLAKRSSAKAGKVPGGTLGAFECIWHVPDPDHEMYGLPVQFELGSGFSAEERQAFWDEWQATGTVAGGALTTFKYQEITADGKPRFQVWKGFRANEDMDAPTTSTTWESVTVVKES